MNFRWSKWSTRRANYLCNDFCLLGVSFHPKKETLFAPLSIFSAFDGFVLESDTGAEVYREFEGESTGSITLGVGDTLELSVHFLDHDGEEIEHEEEEEEEHEDEISVSGYDSNIAIVASEEHEEEEGHDHEEEHGMAIHVIGVESGSTSFKLELMHEEHADYTSTNNIPIVVN